MYYFVTIQEKNEPAGWQVNIAVYKCPEPFLVLCSWLAPFLPDSIFSHSLALIPLVSALNVSAYKCSYSSSANSQTAS